MKRALPTVLTRIMVAVAVLMFVIGGGSFNHAVASHEHSAVEHADGKDHHHATPADGAEPEIQMAHCGANLLALTCEVELTLPNRAERRQTGFSQGGCPRPKPSIRRLPGFLPDFS